MSNETNSNIVSESIYRTFEEKHPEEKKKKVDMPSKNVEKTLKLDLDKESLLQGIILSEVLGSPKSKRRGERLGNRRKILKGFNCGE